MSQDDQEQSLSFEQALKELEEIVDRLERGEAPLEESISLYERGEKLRIHCQNLLSRAEEKIRKIRLDESGKPVGVEPLDAEGADSGDADAGGSGGAGGGGNGGSVGSGGGGAEGDGKGKGDGDLPF